MIVRQSRHALIDMADPMFRNGELLVPEVMEECGGLIIMVGIHLVVEEEEVVEVSKEIIHGSHIPRVRTITALQIK